jgi:two-component system chemotaxis response regulator CheY
MPRYQPKILIVDDNDLIRTLLRGMLRGEEYHVVGEARNGLQGVEAVQKLTPDIVCLDVMMPERDGLEALQVMKQAKPDLVVVMITGNPSVENVQESIQGGAAGFIVKPFNTAKVLDTLSRAWSTAVAAKAAADQLPPAAAAE